MINRIDSIVFDLDGTLWDTCSVCAIAWNNVLVRQGIAFREITAEDVRKVTGKPHEVCIRETFEGLAEAQIAALITDTMTEDNSMLARYGGEIYQGVALGLQELAVRYRLFIVSNCQAGYIETFLAASGFDRMFHDFECWGNTRRPKAENLAEVIRRNALKNPVMVGDTEGDLTAARSCGIPFLHVTYGYGKVLSCDKSFDSFADLHSFLAAAN